MRGRGLDHNHLAGGGLVRRESGIRNGLLTLHLRHTPRLHC